MVEGVVWEYPSKMSCVRFAFIGCGAIARLHLRALRENAHQHSSQLVAAVDTRKATASKLAEFAQPDQCKVFESVDQCLSWGEFDAAVVMTPHHLHERHASALLTAGKHVLLEKPLAHTLTSCKALLRVAEQSKSVFMIGENSAHWPEILKAKELLENGAIGKPYFVQANYWESFGQATFLEDLEEQMEAGGNWRFQPELSGGGILIDGVTHWVRPMRIWLGEISKVAGFVDYPLKASKCESLAHVLLQFKDGAKGVLHGHFMDIPMYKLPFFQIFGDKGEITIHGSFLDEGMTLYNQDNPKGKHIGSLGGYSAAFTPQMTVFLNAIASGQRLPDSGPKALGEVLVAKATYKSAQTDKWEAVTLQNLENNYVD